LAFQPLSCSSCGASDVQREAGRFLCSFCGATVIPRLLPGTLCGEQEGAVCSHPAETVCAVCARPLCDRHNDPKTIHWPAPLNWRRLLPDWDERDGADWAHINAPFQKFPVAGIEPFPWVPHARENLYQAGLVEEEMLAQMRSLVHEAAGDADEVACRFESICSACERELTGRVEKRVSEFSDRWRRVAFVERLAAFAAEGEQELRYIEAFLNRPIRKVDDEGAGEEPLYPDLSASSPRKDWDRCGWEVKARLGLVERLRSKVRA
jgi:predicted RNA-binding Zn-ribbon protein involved in translation (DUF1610 family)